MSIESKIDMKIQTLEKAKENWVTSVDGEIKLLSLMRTRPQLANEVLTKGLSELGGENKVGAIKWMRIALDFLELNQ